MTRSGRHGYADDMKLLRVFPVAQKKKERFLFFFFFPLGHLKKFKAASIEQGMRVRQNAKLQRLHVETRNLGERSVRPVAFGDFRSNAHVLLRTASAFVSPIVKKETRKTIVPITIKAEQ